VLPFGRLWYDEPDAVSNSVGYAKFCSRSHNAVIRVYDEAGNVIETHDDKAISKSGERDETAKRQQEWPLCKRCAALAQRRSS
jgi:hypothetical protein